MEGDNNDKHPGPNGNKFNVDDLMLSLMRSSAPSSDPETDEFVDMNSISGEYSALNNTIDELNKFLDVWDARHDQLRSEIKEALKEATENHDTSDSSEDVGEASAMEKPSLSEGSLPESKAEESPTDSQPSSDLDAS